MVAIAVSLRGFSCWITLDCCPQSLIVSDFVQLFCANTCSMAVLTCQRMVGLLSDGPFVHTSKSTWWIQSYTDGLYGAETFWVTVYHECEPLCCSLTTGSDIWVTNLATTCHSKGFAHDLYIFELLWKSIVLKKCRFSRREFFLGSHSILQALHPSNVPRWIRMGFGISTSWVVWKRWGAFLWPFFLGIVLPKI